MGYIVDSEDKLGLMIGTPDKNTGLVRMSVICVDVEKGGDPGLVNRVVLVNNYRAATIEDEDRFCIRLFDDLQRL